MIFTGESLLYKWVPSLAVFDQIQSFPSQLVTDACSLCFHNETFLLAIATADPKHHQSRTTVWVLEQGESKFWLMQELETYMPSAIEMFSIDNEYFMAVAMSLDAHSSSTTTLSNIYKLRGMKWELIQEIPTAGASDLAYFSDGEHHFLAVSNERTEHLHTQVPDTSGVATYLFIHGDCAFVPHFNIAVPFPTGLQTFSVKAGIRYLSVAIEGVGIKVFRLHLSVGYQHILTIPQEMITHHQIFAIDEEIYLAVGSEVLSACKSRPEELAPRILKAQLTGKL